MKKSPMSRFNGNQGAQPNSPSYNRQWPNNKRMVYGNFRDNNSPQGTNYCQDSRNNQGNSGNAFIPFGTSSPIQQRSYGDMGQTSGGCNFRGYNNHGNKFSNSPRFGQNNSHSPFQHSPRQNYGKKNLQKNHKKCVDIKKYLDLESIFENPWAELEDLFNSKVKRSSPSADSASVCLTDKSDISVSSQNIQSSPECS